LFSAENCRDDFRVVSTVLAMFVLATVAAALVRER